MQRKHFSRSYKKYLLASWEVIQKENIIHDCNADFEYSSIMGTILFLSIKVLPFFLVQTTVIFIIVK